MGEKILKDLWRYGQSNYGIWSQNRSRHLTRDAEDEKNSTNNARRGTLRLCPSTFNWKCVLVETVKNVSS